MKPGEPVVYVLRGPGGDFEIEQGIFSGSARDDNPRAWKHGQKVLVPHVSSFGNRDDDTGAEDWEPLPNGSALEAYALPPQERKDGSGSFYRLLKLITSQGSAEQAKRFERGRIPTAVPFPNAPPIPDLLESPEKRPKNEAAAARNGKPKTGSEQLELF